MDSDEEVEITKNNITDQRHLATCVSVTSPVWIDFSTKYIEHLTTTLVWKSFALPWKLIYSANVTKHTRRHPHLHSKETVLGSMQDVKGVPFAWTWLFHDGTAASIDLILIRYQFQPTTSSQQNRIFPLPVSCLEPQILSPLTPSALLSRNCLPRSFLWGHVCSVIFFLNGPLDVSDVLRYSTPRVVDVLRWGRSARLVGGANTVVAVTT